MPETAAPSSGSGPSGSDPGGAGKKPPLDDVMLAMDVVDTLRYADSLVERELSSDERDRQLKERLRKIYESQGLEVTDRILDEGVAALREDRFVYDPPKSGGGRWLAMLWVRRGTWGKGALIALAILAVCVGGYYFGVKLPEERRIAGQVEALTVTLPKLIEDEVNRVRAVSQVPEAVSRAEGLAREGLAAAEAGDAEAARAKAEALSDLRNQLEQAYTIRVVSRPGEPSGVYRIPDANPDARNYYLIVEAIGPEGGALTVPVVSEETGATQLANIWGVRVEEGVYNAVAADKQDDGIIQRNVLGEKQRGRLEPDYAVPVQGGAILEW